MDRLQILNALWLKSLYYISTLFYLTGFDTVQTN